MGDGGEIEIYILTYAALAYQKILRGLKNLLENACVCFLIVLFVFQTRYPKSYRTGREKEKTFRLLYEKKTGPSSTKCTIFLYLYGPLYISIRIVGSLRKESWCIKIPWLLPKSPRRLIAQRIVVH